jgi:predicted DNA-binding protein with PD1-like motif
MSSEFHFLKLAPGEDLKLSLAKFCLAHNLSAAAIVSCVGSLRQLHLRLASGKDFLKLPKLFEIVSLVGTLSIHGIHLHLSVADTSGAVIGGHLMDENLIHTTAEIVIAEFDDVHFERKFDEMTGYKELAIVKTNQS